MGKLFLLIVFAAVVYLLLKRGSRRSTASTAPPVQAPEQMIQCAHCRVHLPLSESVSEGSRRYCCEEHRRLGRG